ncbi:MAG: tetratricopeptide repeat protein [Aquificaceae bacterium]
MKKFLPLFLLFLLSCSVQEKEDVKGWQFYYDLGMSSYIAKNYSDAIANFYKAVSIAPKEPKVWNALGLAYMAAKEYEKSEDAFNKALQVDITFTEAKMNLGILYYISDNYDKARQTLEETLEDETFPQKHMVYYYLAKAYKAIGHEEGYTMYLEKSTAYYPLFFDAQWELAKEYERKGDYTKAMEVYTFLLNNDTNTPFALLSLARVNFELGDYKLSKDYIKQLLDMKNVDNLIKTQTYELLNKVLLKEQSQYIAKQQLETAEETEKKQAKPTEKEPENKKETFYSIQIGAFSSYEGADNFKRAVERKLSLKDISVVEKAGIYRVMYGKFKTREEAKGKLERLIKYKLSGFITEEFSR